jgi:hypothetical protein
MTPEDINKAIAEYCGWVPIMEPYDFCGETGEVEQWALYNNKGERIGYGLPNFYGDLDAMHEAEMLLDGPNGSLSAFDKYADTLAGLFGRSIRASAAERAEAFVRTIGKWQ